MKTGWCQENGQIYNKRKNESDSNGPDIKRIKAERSNEEDDNEEEFMNLWKISKARGEDKYEQMCGQYVSNGEFVSDAEQLATERMEACDRSKFVELYGALLENYLFPLRTNSFHRQIMSDMDTLRTKVSLTTAVKRVLRRYRLQLQDLYDGFANDEDNKASDDDGSDNKEEWIGITCH